MKTIALYFGLAAGLAFAQMDQSGVTQNGDPHPEIRGVITEAGTHFGIAGLQVLLTKDGQPAASSSTTVTDSQGAFRFQPDDFGHYKVEVKMEGYRIVTDLEHVDQNFNNPAVVVITRGNPREEIRFTLAQAAEMTGRVIDDETGQPLAKFSVEAVGLAYTRGRRSFSLQPRIRALTDDDGRFVFSAIMPGDYAVKTLPRGLGADRVLTTFSETDLSAIDEDYETTYWPGGGGLDSASPIPVASGQSVSAGNIHVRKVPYYRVRAVFSGDSCDPGGRVQMQFQLRFGNLVGESVSAEVSCGMDFLIRNVQPGSYRLSLATRGAPEARRQAIASVVVTDKNLDVPISLARGVDLDGRVIFPEGASQTSFDKLRVGVAGGSPTLDAQGRFQVVNALPGPTYVSFLGLTNGFYLREIRYNGSAISGNTLTLAGDSSSQSLEFVIDDKPASVRGVVAKDDQPLSKPYVTLAKWPFTSESLSLDLKDTTGDEQGNFRFAGLAPGEYRILAVPPQTKDKLDEPGVLERLFADAAKVTLDRGESQSVQVKPADPLH